MKAKPKAIQEFVRRKDQVVWKLVDGKAFLLNLESGDYFDVNLTGLTLWKLCDGKKNIETIHLLAARELKVKPEKIHKDVIDFMRHLKGSKLVEIVSKSTSAIKQR